MGHGGGENAHSALSDLVSDPYALAMIILVTGAAGFIGAETCRALLARGSQVVGIDNLNDHYDPALKQVGQGQNIENGPPAASNT